MRVYMEKLRNGKSTMIPSESWQCKSEQNTVKLHKKRLENQEVIQKKQELLMKLNKSQTQWNNNEQKASCLTLRNALNLIIEIVDNQHIEEVKNVYKQKFNVLKNRLIEREQQIVYLKNTESKKLNKSDNIKKTGIDQVVLQQKNMNLNNLSINQMIGLKNLFKKQIQLQIKVPEIFIETIKPKNIFLFFGPGSQIAKLVKYWIAEIFHNIYTISYDKFDQCPEKQAAIEFLFKSALSNLPSVIFLPQIDRLFNQDQQISSIIKHLSQISQQSNNLYFIGTTNLPWILNPQTGKIFQQKIYIGLPSKEQRIQIIKNKLKGNLNTLNENDVDKIASLCQNYSIDDIDILVRAALFQPIKKWENNVKSNEYWKTIQNLSVSVKDFEVVLKNIKPSLGMNELKKYEQYRKLFAQKQ